MRILDINNNEIVNPTPDMGNLIEEQILIASHPEQDFIKEEGHYEVIREYPNGGRDVKWIVDVPGQKACEAWDEYETILRLVPFSEVELANQRISSLKAYLEASDYNILKIIEGAATLEEKADIIAQRAEWRKEINELEEFINN